MTTREVPLGVVCYAWLLGVDSNEFTRDKDVNELKKQQLEIDLKIGCCLPCTMMANTASEYDECG
jgi:hypothetical protein